MRALLGLALVVAFAFAGCATKSVPSTSVGDGLATAKGNSTTAPPVHVVLNVPPRVATQNETAWVNGTATPGATVLPIDVHGSPAKATAGADGRFSLPLASPVAGHRLRQLGAFLGSGAAYANLTVVRFAQATMQVHFGGYPGHTDRDDKVWYDPDGNASASMYAGKDLGHPNYADVHDLMVTWTNTTGVQVEYGYSSGLGFSVSRIDGAGVPVNAPAGLPSVQNDYWCYDLNGASASKGITDQPLAPGDVVSWSLGCSS